MQVRSEGCACEGSTYKGQFALKILNVHEVVRTSQAETALPIDRSAAKGTLGRPEGSNCSTDFSEQFKSDRGRDWWSGKSLQDRDNGCAVHVSAAAVSIVCWRPDRSFVPYPYSATSLAFGSPPLF
ncbi:hypothetical protein KIN20_016197 [Parelaphostrongylus tenuis]|uniref:Uncharacterized protein n=1 Tax=Parelaphostrongylus tenuis TaxID=148309 RepID=A0AAD5QQJ7_PARTN|nr:hypothetical protein KIN20_016197 [Parelaphostrongylus tenuis]